jgi:ribonuclease BN (tRNA processing enzyme)
MRYRIVFLGTGTADNEERCQSAYALVDPEGAFLLFDTGSGLETLKQIVRAGLEPTMLRGIFLTHRHWDHAAGLLPLLLWLRLRHPEIAARITVHGSTETMSAMAEMHRLSGHRGQFSFCDLAPEQSITPWSGCAVEAIAVQHITGSLGYRVRLPRTVLVLSGDTAPAETVAAAAREADILIHEASFDRAQEAKAADLRHTTGEQAGALASRAAVRRLILTHLVPDSLIPRARLQTEAEVAFGGKVELADDLWSIELVG